MEGVMHLVILVAPAVLSGILFATLSPAFAGIGEAVAVIPETTASGEVGLRTLVVGTEVFIGDLVESGPIGEAQLLFADDTKLVVGPNSSLVIDTYVLRNERTVSNLAINAVRGSFRFISGDSPSDAYHLTTPTATIGVRGTSFDIAVDRDLTEVLVYSGSTEVCDLSGQCEIVEAGCGLAVASGQGVLASFTDEEKATQILESFPYTLEQERLLSDFQVGTGTCLALLGIDPLDAPAALEIEGSPN
jgi:hypothetical protein